MQKAFILLIRKNIGQPGIFFLGHWGWEYYFEKELNAKPVISFDPDQFKKRGILS